MGLFSGGGGMGDIFRLYSIECRLVHGFLQGGNCEGICLDS